MYSEIHPSRQQLSPRVMRLTIPIYPDALPHLPALLNTLSASEPGPGHQVYVLTSTECLAEAEKFATELRQKTKFGGVVLSAVFLSQMSHPGNFLWVSYFRNPHPHTLWFDPGTVVVGKAGWLTRIEDSLRFATSLFLGPQELHTTGVYRAGASRRLNANSCPCVKGISLPVHHAYAGSLISIYRAGTFAHLTDAVDRYPHGTEIIVPRTWGKVLVSRKSAPAPVSEPTPEVTPEPTPEVVAVDTETKSEVIARVPTVIRRKP